MRAFLREYWLWIAVPVVLVIAGILILIFWGKGSEPGPMVYPVF